MTAIHVPDSQQSSSVAPLRFFDLHTLRAGNAVSLRSRRPMRLQLLACSGSAWITLGDAPRREAAPADQDLVLAAGQVLEVRAGRHVVLEPLAGQAVRYRWSAAKAG